MGKLREYTAVYGIGSVGYAGIEMLWRGRTHWSMAVAGGVCLSLFYRIRKLFRKPRLLALCALGTAVITAVEFCVGMIVNVRLRWNVWDYSRCRLNVKGQICPLYSALWFLLCIPMEFLCRGIDRRFLSEKKRGKGLSSVKN